MKLVTLKDQRLGRVEDERIIPFDFPGGMLPGDIHLTGTPDGVGVLSNKNNYDLSMTCGKINLSQN
ncbi:MAG: hypothetical protein HC875_11225 [Anaerolineales bacterium]|nr:hypothetical protein [Anaerolineales bacterium]